MKKDKKLRAKIQALENELSSKSKIKKSFQILKSKGNEVRGSVADKNTNTREIKIDILKSVIFITISFVGVYILGAYFLK